VLRCAVPRRMWRAFVGPDVEYVRVRVLLQVGRIEMGVPGMYRYVCAQTVKQRAGSLCGNSLRDVASRAPSWIVIDGLMLKVSRR
jgi:hypothetical protein